MSGNKIENVDVIEEIFVEFNKSKNLCADFMRIHKDMHRFNLKINYRSHKEDLLKIADELERIEFKIGYLMKKNKGIIRKDDMKEFIKLLLEYIGDSRTAVICLKSLAGRLADQAEGIQMLPLKEQKMMIDEYYRLFNEFEFKREKLLRILDTFNILKKIQKE